ncbi:SDR family NAD(P)-dependent oxidoreductase [Microbacterium sp.]|uniref:SDR family NAD(P)-dependent oxidoreductase n=1 Tax=Microbacterium sp. TaxID=51671 RepID=UPI0035ADA62A
MRDEGQVVVITGASSGIGRATARRYASRGARLVLASRSREALETVAAECRERGAQVSVVPTDVTQQGEVRALAASAVAEFGRIDVWVGNAGVFSYGSFESTPERVFRQVVETNLMGQVHGARAVLPYFRRQGSGTLVLVGSLYSRVSARDISPYIASKWGLLGFAEVLRQELRASRGIRVRIILPATIDTPIYQHAANVTGRRVHPLPPASSPERVARAIVRAPRRRRFTTFVGLSQRSVIPLHRAAPPLYDGLTSLLKRRVELRGHAPLSDGTVFEPPANASSATGGWRSPMRPIVALGIAAGALALAAVKGQRKPSA